LSITDTRNHSPLEVEGLRRYSTWALDSDQLVHANASPVVPKQWIKETPHDLYIRDSPMILCKKVANQVLGRGIAATIKLQVSRQTLSCQ
jgi:hypothetical protein